MLQYVMKRSFVDLGKIEMDFSIYEQDIYEQRVRIPLLKELFQKKMELLDLFQNGRDIWKTRK